MWSKFGIEMTPLCKIEVTHPRVLGSRLASTLVVDFRMDPQRRAAVWLRWPSAQSAKVELQDFNLERERTDDRREISAGRAAGEGWRERFSASRGGGGIAVADGERRRGADRRRAIRAQRRADHLAQRLPRPDPGYPARRAAVAHPETAAG